MRAVVDFLASVGPGLVVLGIIAVVLVWLRLGGRRSLGSLGSGPLGYSTDASAKPLPMPVDAKRIVDELTTLNGSLEWHVDHLAARAGLPPLEPGTHVYDNVRALPLLDARLDAIERALDLPPLEPSDPRSPKATP